MDLDTTPASDFPLADLVQYLNQGFEDYFVPIQFNTSTFLNMIRRDGIDLTGSQVLMVDNQPCGIALIARRGWTSRLAAMGIAKRMRGKGAGSWFMNELIKEARQRDDREMVLEVIEQNESAVKLYQKSGFEIVRRLIGFTHKGKNVQKREKADFHEMDLREMGRLILQHGLSDLPWQLSGESVALMNPPACAYRCGQAYIVISNPTVEHVVIWSLLVDPRARGHGQGTAMLKNVIAHHRDKIWHVPAVFPEEFGQVFEGAGFERESLSQWQMKLNL
jgi:ribosomal protein S18 acetylase RimI-like enzyme